jgi:hypothetical protein
MGGKKCLENLLLIDPHVRVLIASGFISKPYDAQDILGAIRKALDGNHQ